MVGNENELCEFITRADICGVCMVSYQTVDGALSDSSASSDEAGRLESAISL